MIFYILHTLSETNTRALKIPLFLSEANVSHFDCVYRDTSTYTIIDLAQSSEILCTHKNCFIINEKKPRKGFLFSHYPQEYRANIHRFYPTYENIHIFKLMDIIVNI